MPEDRDDNFIDIDAEDLAEEPQEPDVLEITSDDLQDVPDGPPAPQEPASREYPGVDPKDLQGEKSAGLTEMTAICSASGGAFRVLWEQIEPDVYGVVGVESAGPEAKQKAGGGAVAVDGHFALDDFPGCPHCGAMRMSVCEECGLTMCEGGMNTNLLGMATLKCPACGNRGRIEGSAGRIWGSGGKGRGGKK
jgi:hypothetical protein